MFENSWTRIHDDASCMSRLIDFYLVILSETNEYYINILHMMIWRVTSWWSTIITLILILVYSWLKELQISRNSRAHLFVAVRATFLTTNSKLEIYEVSEIPRNRWRAWSGLLLWISLQIASLRNHVHHPRFLNIVILVLSSEYYIRRQSWHLFDIVTDQLLFDVRVHIIRSTLIKFCKQLLILTIQVCIDVFEFDRAEFFHFR